MALVLLQSGSQPLGQFDGLDSQVSLFKGGEVCTWGSVTYQGSDEASADVNNDGYVGTTSKMRPAVTYTLSATSKPLFLSDDGTLNYGTLFGEIVGATVGQQVSNGVVLGPSTTTGSGKVTLWDKPGLYGVTLDACDTEANGLVPTNSALVVGNPLTFTATGQLTPPSSSLAISASTTGATVVGRLAEFSPKGSLVTTPNTLVAALNSPSGDVTSVQQASMYMAVFWYNGAGGNA